MQAIQNYFLAHDFVMEPRLLLQWLLDRDGDNSNSLAKKLKNATTQPQIHKFLSGKAKQPRHSTLEPVATHYGIPINALYSEEEAERVMGLLQSGVNPPDKKVQPVAQPSQVPFVPDQCAAIMSMLSTLPDDPVIRWQVMGQIAEVIAKARGSPVAHRTPPAYSPTATRSADPVG